jgi:hypothetical protein
MTQKQEIEAVNQLGDAIGYGNMMTLATALWRKSLRDEEYPQSDAFIATIYGLLDEDGKRIADKEFHFYDKLIEKVLEKNHIIMGPKPVVKLKSMVCADL